MIEIRKSDITNWSESIVDLFSIKIEVLDKTAEWLKEKNYTHDELVMISKIVEKDCGNYSEYGLNPVERLCGKLIRVQKESFSLAIFNAYIDKIVNNKDALLHILKNTIGLTDIEKMKWVKVALVNHHHWFIPTFFKTESAIKHGIDIYKTPFNLLIAKSIVESNVDIKSAEGFLISILNSLTEEEFNEWYDESASKCLYQTSIAKILSQYERTTVKILEDYFFKLEKTEDKIELAKHPNSPKKLKTILFKLTGDMEFAPPILKELFCF